MRERRVVVVGGGITGLAAADAAATRANETGRPLSLTLVEGARRFGGSVVTERVDGFLLDGGADSWVASKPHATALARDLGLAPAIIGTNDATRRYYIARGDRLYPVPEGLVLGVPTRLAPLALTSLFSWRGKARMALEPLVPARRFEGDDDESIADFAARRLGREAADRLVGPLLGGISAGDATQVSARAAFPQLVAMERDHGSLVRGMRAAKRARGGGPQPSAFLSLEGGTGSLVDALVERLRRGSARLRSGMGVRRLARSDDVWRVELDSGESLDADAVLLAVPAHASARLVADLPGELAGALAALRYVSTATVFLAYRAADVPHKLDGVGFVVPPALRRPILAATWVSSKWSGRAPEGHVLLRAFLGGAGREAVLARDDAALAALAAEDLARWMTLAGPPLWSKVFRFDAARPQMLVGHLATMRAIRERLARVAPGVHLAAGGFDGDGIPDCIRQGQAAGRAMIDAG